MNYDKIGKFIAELRKEKKLTQKELASKIGVTDKAVSKWERGLGCPDVSILEILSKELGVSILEVLKGRIIENEVIAVTELNDYVLETVHYSKNELSRKYKNIICHAISTIIIGICSFLFIVNINHMVYLNSTEYYDFDNDHIKEIKSNIEVIKENINVIKKDQGIYSLEDYNEFISCLDQSYNDLLKMEILNYSGLNIINLKDLYVINLTRPGQFCIISKYKILEKYNNNLNYSKLIEYSYISKIFSSDRSQRYNYQYKIIDLINAESYYASTSKINIQVFDILYYTEELKYFTNNIIEVGDISE